MTLINSLVINCSSLCAGPSAPASKKYSGRKQQWGGWRSGTRMQESVPQPGPREERRPRAPSPPPPARYPGDSPRRPAHRTCSQKCAEPFPQSPRPQVPGRSLPVPAGHLGAAPTPSCGPAAAPGGRRVPAGGLQVCRPPSAPSGRRGAHLERHLAHVRGRPAGPRALPAWTPARPCLPPSPAAFRRGAASAAPRAPAAADRAGPGAGGGGGERKEGGGRREKEGGRRRGGKGHPPDDPPPSPYPPIPTPPAPPYLPHKHSQLRLHCAHTTHTHAHTHTHTHEVHARTAAHSQPHITLHTSRLTLSHSKLNTPPVHTLQPPHTHNPSHVFNPSWKPSSAFNLLDNPRQS